MTTLTQQLQQLSSAEDFLNYFGVIYDPKVVHVNRLHILKRFTQYLKRESLEGADDEVTQFRRYRELLTRAYQDFTVSNAVQEKVFKVFQDAEGQQRVGLDGLRASLTERRQAA